jgi:DNA repair exonuclease SbcCD ATPase subunit
LRRLLENTEGLPVLVEELRSKLRGAENELGRAKQLLKDRENDIEILSSKNSDLEKRLKELPELRNKVEELSNLVDDL